MEIRQGYKQTEVGIIPEEWEVKKIKDILEIGSGKDYKKLSSGDIPVFGTGGYMLNVDDFLYDGESVFIGRKGTINKPFYYKGKFWTVDTLFYTYNFRNVFPKWVLYKFDTINWLKYNEASGVPSLSKQTIYNIDIAIPPLKEQEKIAEILSYYDEAIEQQELLIEKEKDFKKGMMQKIFSQEIRFKDDNGEDYPEWEENKIADIFKITRGYVLAKTDIKEKITDNFIYPVFSSQTLNNGLMGFYNKYLYENSITWTTDGANAGTVKYRTGKFYCTNVCGVLISDIYSNKCIAEILAKEAPKHVSYIGNPKLMNNVMGAIKIIIPISLEEQQKIANFLSDIDNKIELLENKLELLKNEKKGMMQKLLTGEVRVQI